MPRSAGTYTLPANSLAVSGTTISSTYFNAALNDIASELTASVPRDGTGAMSAGLQGYSGTASAPSFTFSADATTGLYRKAAGSIGFASAGVEVAYLSSTGMIGKAFDVDAITTVASATTTDIGAAATQEVTVSGTTTITGLGTSAAGIRRRVRFSGALTLTHNGTSLILPGALNIITVANDYAEFLSLGSGNWICTGYNAIGGRAGLELIARGTASSVASIDLSLPAIYASYELHIDRLKPATDGANLLLRLSTDGGSTYIATLYSYTYMYSENGGTTVTSTNQAGGGGATGVLLMAGVENTTVWACSSRVVIIPPVTGSTDTVTSFQIHGGLITASGSALQQFVTVGGVIADPPTHLRFIASSGNIADCVYRLYGVRA